jgi:hypothetical protein
VSLNAVVGETNDSVLNDIRAPRPKIDEILSAISAAKSGAVDEGAVGAGTGTVAFGLKGGIGTSSRLVRIDKETFTVGVLVQSNYGGRLTVAGRAYEAELQHDKDGSIVIVLATDAPLCSRNLQRLGRALLRRPGPHRCRPKQRLGRLRLGIFDCRLRASHACTAEGDRRRLRRCRTMSCRRCSRRRSKATEEAIINSLTMATTTSGFNARTDRPRPSRPSLFALSVSADPHFIIRSFHACQDCPHRLSQRCLPARERSPSVDLRSRISVRRRHLRSHRRARRQADRQCAAHGAPGAQRRRDRRPPACDHRRDRGDRKAAGGREQADRGVVYLQYTAAPRIEISSIRTICNRPCCCLRR